MDGSLSPSMVLLKISLRTASRSTIQCNYSFLSHFLAMLIVFYSWPSDAPSQYIDFFKNLAGAIRNNEELGAKWTQVIEIKLC
jgi:hypothetical protein